MNWKYRDLTFLAIARLLKSAWRRVTGHFLTTTGKTSITNDDICFSIRTGIRPVTRTDRAKSALFPTPCLLLIPTYVPYYKLQNLMTGHFAQAASK